MCSSKILFLEFLFAFMFFTAAHFSSVVAASISHFLTAAMKFHVFLPKKFVSFVLTEGLLKWNF